MGTRIKTHITPKMRIISFVLAFVMVFVGLPYVGGNMEVKAEATGPNIYSDTKYSSIMGASGHIDSTENYRYHYTGKITKAKVTMFDYVSDYEINGNYNQCWQNEQGYVDAYQGFNSLISNSSPSFDNSATSNVTTITYKSEAFLTTDNVKVHVWREDTNFYDLNMVYDPNIQRFTCTYNPDNIDGNDKNLWPLHLIFYKGSWDDQTNDYDLSAQLEKNHTYDFYDDKTRFEIKTTDNRDIHGKTLRLQNGANVFYGTVKWFRDDGSDKYFYCDDFNGYDWIPTEFEVQDVTGTKSCPGFKKGRTNLFDTSGNLISTTPLKIPIHLGSDQNHSKYTNPLYFGCFWKDNEPSGYKRSNTPSYNNFWWQANMGFKPYDTNNRGNASVQGLVKSELSGGAAGKLMDVRSTDSNPVELPYFSKTFNSTYIKYYDKDNTGDNINFPFYECYIAASSSYVLKSVSDSNLESEKAKFYQFCSKDSNLQFVTTDVNDHKGYFTETTTPIIHGDTQDFLPFNATDSHNTDDGKDYNNHNLGFGAKFETTFKLQRDGCVGATNWEGGSLVDVDSDTRIHTIFEFTGDDDLWVFIDGNLVLDMGGAHLESNGIIDFATKTATAYRARTLGDGVSLQDLNLDYQEKSIDFTSLLKPDSFYTDTETGNTYYNPNVSHTLTVFYMERGMLDSNLLIRFNYSPEANFSKMKITEVTDFDNINEGLKNATMKAAEDDVFMYTVTNTNTKSEDVKTNSARFPVAAQSIRTNQSVTTQLTPGTGSPGTASIDFVPSAQDVPTAVANTSYLWVDEFADNSKIVGKSNGSGQLYLMYGTCKNLYPSAEETKVGKESSAEFEKQFTRNSTMAVLQSDTLYKPNRASSPGLFGDSNLVTGNQLSSVPTATRSVSAYYTTTKIVKDRDKNTIPFINANNGTFTFNNDASVDAGSSVMLTEYFTNTPRIGAITIKKELPTGETVSPANKAFTIKVRFEDIFGVTNVDADDETDYTGITYKVYDSANTSGVAHTMGHSTTTNGETCGTITLKVGQTATIEDIPVGTKYYIYEEEPKYKPDPLDSNGVISSGTVVEGEIKDTPSASPKSQSPTGAGGAYQNNANNVTVTNFSHSLTIKEVTDFSTVNSGLLTYTKKAAENDVFKYTVKNDSNVNGANSWIPVATYDTYQRQANGASSPVVFSGRPLQYEEIDDVDHVYLDVSRDISGGHWYDSTPVFVAWLYNADPEEGVPVEFSYVSENLYKVDPGDYQNIAILRVYKSQIQTDWGNEWINHIWETRKNNSNKVYLWGRIDPRPLTKGYTYIPTDFNNVNNVLRKDNYKYNFIYIATPHKIQTSNIIYDYSYNNFIHDSSDYVKNVNYEWVDEFAEKTSGTANDLLAGTTDDNTGSFYLMHGETNATNGGSGDHESSATFYNQFARGSTMTVEQGDKLTSPVGGSSIDTLQANNKRGADTSLEDYYTTTRKTLEGGIANAPNANDTFTYNNNTTGLTNSSIHITETFTNAVNVGTLKITKEINPTETDPDSKNTTMKNAVFKFRIKLTKVFGVDGNDVSNSGTATYSGITVSRSGTGNENYTMTNYTDDTDPDNPVYYGEFELKQGETLTIEKIPYNTHYEIQEVGQTGANPYYVFNSVKSTTDNGTTWSTPVTSSATVLGDIVADQTKEFKYANKRKVGPLVLSKTVNGGTNANSGNQTNGSFTFKVELTEPTGVTFSGNYMTEAANLLRIKNDNYDSANHKYTFYETVTGGGTVTIPSVPYGTAYNVTEVYYDTATSTWKTVGSPDYPDPDHPDVSGNHVTGTIGQSLTVANTNAAEITNTYRKVTLTKLDSKDNDTSTGFKVDSAKYILLKLKDDLVITDAVKNIFASAESITDLHPEGEPSNLFYQDFSTEFTTGDTTKEFGSGQIVVRDSDITHGLTAGKYFFFETAAAGDNYDVDNTLTDAKIIEINATNDTTNDPNYTYTVDHTDPRKTGSLKLQKRLDDGTSDSTTEFTYHVELTNESTDVDLTKYMTQTPTTGEGANISGAAQAVSIANADYNAHKIEFDIKIKSNMDVTISNIPYDVTYTVTEDTLPSSAWKKVGSEVYSDKASDPSATPTINSATTDTVTVTNALVGDLVLNKTLGSNASTHSITPSSTFKFEVTLTPPDNMSLDDFITNYIGTDNVGGTDANLKFIKIDTDTKLKRIFEIAGDNSNHTAVSGLPYGTKYTVVEADESQYKTETITYALNGTVGAITNKTIGANNVVTTTNNYPELGSLNIAKTITGDNAPDDQQFTFTVTLTPQEETLIDLKDFTFTNTGGSDFTVSSNHKTITVKLTGGNNVTISGIPVGTVYAVSEGSVDDWTQTDSSNTSGTISADGIHASFTNNYGVPITVTASLTITKTDTNGTAITSSPATYYLLKLNAAFDTAYADNPATLSNTFKNAASPSDLSQYYSGYYGPKQTDSSGQVVFDTNDSGLTIATGDKFFFYEAQAPYGYAIDNSLTYVDSSGNTHSKILSVTAADTNPTAVYPNPNTTGVSVYKTNEYGEGLENGEFDLYYKQENNNTTTPPPTYSYNKPETPPVPEATTKINRNNLTVPDDAAGTSQVTTYTYEYNYPFEPSMPSSAEEDWILPRSDNDYIYFRDYNTGTVNSKDTEAFFYQDYENNQKRYWINTWLNNNEFGQNEEIGYDHRYKIKAQFKKSDDSGFKEYEAWERFVDEYTDTANNVTRKTVVWKIQPPDGYSKVRFCLYDGGQCIRTTQEFKYVLGNIYTKTGQGTDTDNKWNYPVKGEHWSTNWNGTGADQSDKRMDYSSIYQSSGTGWQNTTNYVYNNQSTTSSQQAPEQTQRYTATEQKIVFQCNSKQVWHNIHIEFFSSSDENDRIGQGFPGYMMEPYAFAGNDYRMKGYLTYELTIPKGATHFRINNGVQSGNFAYKTKITPLNTNTTLNNYGNFFKFPNTPQNGSYNTVDLGQWTKPEIQNAGDKYYATYNTADVESDYDYIYFRLPSGSGWSSHVYAYFYGGGDLRAHNWQRGVYSIWPGVAPVATEYSVTDGTDATQHSDHYTYEYTQTLFSETPNNSGNLTGINPESTFQYDGGTVYKFKIPKSERVTYENNGKRVYDKVIFNDGFKKYSANTSTSSNNETGMIGFKAGYIYSPDDTTGKKYYGDATSNYTGRGDYLYIKNAANWDNLHVTFYNANGTAILQGGTGYIMQYEGTDANGKYYRIPIPSGAAKFKLNNGKGSSKTSAMGVIYPKQNAVDTSKKDYTTGDMIYTLNANNSLTKDYPIFSAPQQVSHTSSSTTLQASDVNYVTRGDKLYIRNTANWSGMNIGAVKIKFYDSSNAVIGTGEYTMIVSETESASVASDNRTNGTGSSTTAKWYSIDIPMNAAKFELTAPHATATKYDIYERINSDGSTDRNYKWTKGDMYYETSGTNALKPLYPTYYQSVDYTATDTYANARGDNLYLVVSDLDKWENMRVTFYDGNGTAISNTAGDTAIVPNYVGYKSSSPTNSEAAGYWFRIAIPTGAESFRATGSASNSESGDIYELSQNRTYHFRNDYTPGDMQYRITDTLSGGTYNLSLMYPIFTEEPFYSLNDEVNNSYPTNNITVPTPTSGTNDAPILYETNSDTITYNWTESTGIANGWSDKKIYFVNNVGWDANRIYAHFWGTGITTQDVKLEADGTSGTYIKYSCELPNTGKTQACNVIFFTSPNGNIDNQTSKTADLNLTTFPYGHGKIFTPTLNTTEYIYFVSDLTDNGQYFAYFYSLPNNSNAFYKPWEYEQNNTNQPYNGQTFSYNHTVTYYHTTPQDRTIGNGYYWEIPKSGNNYYQKVKFYRLENQTQTLWESTEINLTNYDNGVNRFFGVGEVNNSNYNGHTQYKFTVEVANGSASGSGSSTNYSGTWSGTAATYDDDEGTTPVEAEYQPEDRYGMISNLNSGTTPVTSEFNDANNFIKIVTNGAVTNPYIKFYASDGTTVIGGGAISLTARLNGSTSDANAGVTQPGDGSSDNPYKIRLPKNAKSVELYDGDTQIGSTIALSNDGGATLTVSGTTVSKTSTTKNSTALQSGVTADEGFIFYKGNMTHAYYYGGVDGEFCAWPGVPYSYSYTDGSDTIYAFQIPTTSNSTSKVYPYVIFNDGTTNSNHTMTAAIDYAGKQVYSPFTPPASQYGSWSTAPITTTSEEKQTPTPQGDPDDTPPEYTEVHLATIVTGADGRQKYIKWLKPKPGAEDEVDTEYLDHVFSDIGKDANKKEVRVKKLGEYYWVETVAPAGYKAVKDKIEFTLTQADTAAGSYITHIVDEPLPGKVLLMKTAKEKVGNTDIGDPLPGAGFNLTTRAVQTTFISVAKKTNKSEYYVIPTDDEEYVALSRSGEYDTDGTVSKTIPDPANPGATTSVTVAELKEYTELFTDENGYIKIENLVWGDYVLTETNNTPSGYAGSLSKVYFTVGKNNSDITQELSLKDEMNPAYIKLFEHINERRNAWGDPTFTFKIKQTHEYVHTYNNGTWTDTLTEIPDYLQKEILVSLTVNDDGTLNSNILRSDFNYWLVESTDEVENTKLEYQGMYHIDSQGRIRVEPGSYEITRMPISRYEFVTSAYTDQYNNGGTAGSQNENLDSNSKPLEKVTISGLAAGKTIDVHYYDKVGYYDKFSQVDTKINKFYTLDSNKNNTTVKGIRIDDYYVADSGTVSGDTLTISTNDVTKFKAYKIMADGTEQQITDSTELAKLAVTYTYDSSSKDDEHFGHQADTSDNDFSYSNSTITVGNVSRYHDSVYKLNVSYTDDTFTTTAAFNLVFEKQSTNVTYYTAQVIFKNDSQDTTSHDPSNISYFEEDNNRTHAYEFTFVIADDGTNKTVSDIRHNGTSIGTGDTAWTSAISDMNNNHFKILDSYSTYNFASWVQLAPSSPNLTDYNSIVGYITGLTPTDGKVDSIEFAAHLTSP